MGVAALLVLAAQTSAHAECTCRHEGGDVMEGGTACLKTPSGFMLARCEKVLNNTSWKNLNQPCPSAALPDHGTRIAALSAGTAPGGWLPKPGVSRHKP